MHGAVFPPVFFFAIDSETESRSKQTERENQMPKGDHCCVPFCTSDRRKGHGLLFHSFPGSNVTKLGEPRQVRAEEKEVRAKWIHAIRRDEVKGVFVVQPYDTVVCSEHFRDEDYVQGTKKPGARLKQTAIPTIFSWREEADTPSRKRRPPVDRHGGSPSKQPREPKSDAAKLSAERKRASHLEDELARARAELEDVEVELTSKSFCLARFESSDSDLQYYTGFPCLASFDACIRFLGLDDDANVISSRSRDDAEMKRARGGGRKSKLTLREKFFLTMVRLRRGTDLRMLADLYFLDTGTVSRILHTMINFLYLRLGKVPIWPTRAQVAAKMPDVFQDLYSTTFAVIDATEIKVEVASSLPAQSQLYSSYKSHTTLKGLVAMTPDGSVCFVSELFGGSISDQELVIRSHLLDRMPSVGYGASIMADKGFDIQDLLVPYGVKLNIPPFKQAGVQMSLQDVQRTQQIAKVRIHIERLIERIKEFNIFSKIIPVTMFPVVNQMWAVCCLLTLFQSPLLAEPKSS